MVCTETYHRRVMGKEQPGAGLGVRWEGSVVYQHIYNAESNNSKFIPVLFEEGKPEHIPTPLQGVARYRVDTQEGYIALYRRLTSQPEITKPELGKLKSMPPRERKQEFARPAWNVPYERNVYFTGRDEELKKLRESLTSGGTAVVNQGQAIYGLGGIGKSQLAVEYAYRYRIEYKAVLWAVADSELSTTTAYLEIARLLDLPEKDAKETEQTVQAVRRWLEQNSRWLLIYDNADRPNLLKHFRPTNAAGHILITSRAHNFDVLGISRPVEVSEMLPDEAVEFLFKRTDRTEHQAATELAKELGYLPLALEQAGAYIREKKVRIQDYLASYRKRHIKLLKESKPVAGDYPKSVATTWEMNFEEVSESTAASELMNLSAYLSADSISFELITKGKAELGAELGTALEGVADDPVLLSEVLEPLISTGLVPRSLLRKYTV
jgi:hypothetical protein